MAFDLRGCVPLFEVQNVADSIAFYRDLLGFSVYQSAGNGNYMAWAWIRNGNVELMLNAMFEADELASPPSAARIAAHRDTTLFIGCPELDAARAHLQAKGVATDGPNVTHYGMRQLSFCDPDGFGICLQWPAA